jgi:pectate lyase
MKFISRIPKWVWIAAFLGSATFHANATTTVSGSYDFGGATLGTSCDGDDEDQEPVVLLKDGAEIYNLKIASGGGADGIHCEGTCTMHGITWLDVCEDAATMKGGSGKTMTIQTGISYNANDKIIQHNSVGGTVIINGFTVNGTNGKFYRSCGNCSTQGARYATLKNITINGTLSSGLAGVNSNYGDQVAIRLIKWKSYVQGSSYPVCVVYKGVTSGEPTKIGTAWNTTNCNVSTTDITAF